MDHPGHCRSAEGSFLSQDVSLLLASPPSSRTTASSTIYPTSSSFYASTHGSSSSPIGSSNEPVSHDHTVNNDNQSNGIFPWMKESRPGGRGRAHRPTSDLSSNVARKAGK
ncbi:homeobox protein Hox A3 [Trichuris trichiura]|uniref:Homeobox protein Hox A3 n=1 Tax=Trichuris trichiura TaxID=36087 RepID=A0A077Z046_TRITR|nr:homeobox protein Hox A3 [Trichuris trichiura]